MFGPVSRGARVSLICSTLIVISWANGGGSSPGTIAGVGRRLFNLIMVCLVGIFFPQCPSRISFFWKGVVSCLPALRFGVSHIVKSGDETLFWKDKWFNGLAPMNVWPEEFRVPRQPNGSVRDLCHLLASAPVVANQDTGPFWVQIRDHVGDLGDEKWWCLMGNGVFSVKFFFITF